MKRIFIVVAAIIAALVFYQFQFADRRAKLRVDPNKIPSADVPFGFNESINQLENLERLLVREGSLFFHVRNIAETKVKVTALVNEYKGYIQKEERNDDYHIRIAQTIRIPSASMDEFLQKTEALAEKVKVKKISSEDITDENVSEEARLSSKKKAESRYQEILKQAKTVEEVLKVEEILTDTRSEIESIEGRIKRDGRQATYAIVDLEYLELRSEEAVTFGASLTEAFTDGWSGLLEVIVFFIKVWPFTVLATAGIWWYFSRRKRFAQPVS